MLGAYGLGLALIVIGVLCWAALDQTRDPVMRMLAELARGSSSVVAFGLLGGGVVIGLVSLIETARGRNRVLRDPPPRVDRFVELIAVWGLGFAGAAAIFAPGVQEALVMRGTLAADGPDTEGSLAVVLGTVGVTVAAVKWFLESTTWVQSPAIRSESRRG
jgi:Mn2+/Fe2+ NRAMP family transporter